MAMSIIKDGSEAGMAPPAPLFASSWIALFLQLRHNLESLRASNEDALEQTDATGVEPHPLDRADND